MAFMVAIVPGSPMVLAAGAIVAMPPGRSLVFSSDAAPSIQGSNDPAFGNNVAITLTNGQAELACGFLKNAGGSPITINVETNLNG